MDFAGHREEWTLTIHNFKLIISTRPINIWASVVPMVTHMASHLDNIGSEMSISGVGFDLRTSTFVTWTSNKKV